MPNPCHYQDHDRSMSKGGPEARPGAFSQSLRLSAVAEPAFGFWVLGFWVLGFGVWVLGFGFWDWVLGFGFWVLGFGFWVLGFGFWVLG